MKKYSTSSIIMEMQIKTATRYHYTPTRIAKIQNTDNTKYGRRCRATGILYIADGNAKCTATLEDSLAVSYKIKHTLTR